MFCYLCAAAGFHRADPRVFLRRASRWSERIDALPAVPGHEHTIHGVMEHGPVFGRKDGAGHRRLHLRRLRGVHVNHRKDRPRPAVVA